MVRYGRRRTSRRRGMRRIKPRRAVRSYRRSARRIKRVVRNMAEKKWVTTYFNLTQTGNTSPQAVKLNVLPSLGTGRGNRIGNAIMGRWFTFRMIFNIATISSTSGLFPVRVILFTWKGGKSIAGPNHSDLVDTASTANEAFNGPFNTEAISVLKSWRLTVGSTTGLSSSIDYGDNKYPVLQFARPFKRNFRWNPSVAAPNDMVNPENEIYLGLIYGGSATITWSFTGASKLSYTDI